MRSRAAAISASRPSERLPAPEARDEIGALGRTLNEMLDRLEAALARERRLVSDASHELRTPLTTMRAELELALRGERDAAELRAAIASADEEARRMSRLADDLLVLARSDQGRLPLRPEPCPAQELLAAAVRRSEAAFAPTGRSITATDGGAAMVLADPDRVAQALDNLIANSLVYGGGPVRADQRGTRGDGRAARARSRRGLQRGIPPLRLRAFQPRRRWPPRAPVSVSPSSRPSPAPTVARVAARNRPGGGADVWLTLPAGLSLREFSPGPVAGSRRRAPCRSSRHRTGGRSSRAGSARRRRPHWSGSRSPRPRRLR